MKQTQEVDKSVDVTAFVALLFVLHTHTHTHTHVCIHATSLMVLVVENSHANAGDIRDVGLIPGSGTFPGEGKGNPVQYFPGETHGQRSLAGYSP